MKTFLVLSLFMAAGCGKNDGGGGGENIGNDIYANDGTGNVSDPEGTIILSVRNSSNGYTYVPVDVSSDIAYTFIIDGGNNFKGDISNYWQFANVGQVCGLGNVTKIPDSGWSPTCGVYPGYGYLGVCYNIYGSNKITFARIYVDSYITSATSGGIIGFVIKYQYPFNGTAEAIGLSVNSVKVNQYVTLNKVSCSSNTACNFLFDETKVSLKFYNAGTYTVSSPGLPDEQITVTP